MWPLYMARAALLAQIKTSTVFQSASNRASGSAIAAINTVIPVDIDEMLKVESNKKVNRYEIINIKNNLQNLETVLSNDMPGVSAYIYSGPRI
jgi:hypothetical protein